MNIYIYYGEVFTRFDSPAWQYILPSPVYGSFDFYVDVVILLFS